MFRFNSTAFAATFVAALAMSAAIAAQTSSSAPPQRAPGIYLEKTGGGEPTRLLGVRTMDMQEKGIAKSMLTAGFSKSEMQERLSGDSASARATTQPEFYFYLGQQQPKGTSGGDMNSMMQQMMNGDNMPQDIRDAGDFTLLRFDVKDGGRIAHVLQGRGGTGFKNTVSCNVEKVGPYIFRVRPKEPLEAGEYGFTMTKGGMGGQFWDFGVDAK
jgi:hypothetical protein